MKKNISLLALLALAACGGTSGYQGDANAYRGYDVQVSSSGDASCGQLSGGEVGAALAASNALRARSGLSPLRANSALNKIAAQQACHMAKTGRMSHASADNGGPKSRAKSVGYAPSIIAENIAAGPYDLGRVVREWEVSSSHRANTTLSSVNDFGIGTATGADGTRYWSAVYARKK